MNTDQIRFYAAEILRLTEAAPAPQQSGIPIADRAALDAALATATGGEVFRLAPGDYGTLAVQPQFAPAVTILGGSFGAIRTSGPNNQTRCKGLILDGVTASYIEFFNIDDAAMVRCDAAQVMLNQAKGVTIQRSHIHDGHFPLRILRSSHVRVIGNVLEGAREDTMRIYGDSHHAEVRGNAFLRNMAAKPMHGDHLQIYGLPTETVCPKDITIEQNLFHDCATGKQVTVMSTGQPGTPAPAQGIFCKDGIGDFERFSIRHNLLRLSMANGIYTGSGKVDWLIEENILAPIYGQQLPRIRLAEFANQPNWNNAGVTVTRNIAPEIMHETPEATVRDDNFTFGWGVGGLFAGIDGADGMGGSEPEHFRLAPGSGVPAQLVENWLEGAIGVIRATLDEVTRG